MPLDELKIARDMQKAQEAKAAIDNGIIAEALAQIEQMAIKEWRSETDGIKRDQKWYVLRGVDLVKGYLNSIIRDGRMAQAEIEQERLNKAVEKELANG